jgi:hypothetical protein
MTVQNLYTQYLDGKITKQKFLYEVRRDQNLTMISPSNSFDDVVKILKNKSIISEKASKESKQPTGKQDVEIIAKTIDMVNPYEYANGMDYELGIIDIPAPDGDLDEDNVLRAQKKVLANLTKNPSYYTEKLYGRVKFDGDETVVINKKSIDAIGKGKKNIIREGIFDKDILSRPLSNPAIEPLERSPEELGKDADVRSQNILQMTYRNQINDPNISDEELRYILSGKGVKGMGGRPNAIEKIIKDRKSTNDSTQPSKMGGVTDMIDYIKSQGGLKENMLKSDYEDILSRSYEELEASREYKPGFRITFRNKNDGKEYEGTVVQSFGPGKFTFKADQDDKIYNNTGMGSNWQITKVINNNDPDADSGFGKWGKLTPRQQADMDTVRAQVDQNKLKENYTPFTINEEQEAVLQRYAEATGIPLDNLKNMVAEAKAKKAKKLADKDLADKDYDSDGELESPRDEYKGSVDKAIKGVKEHGQYFDRVSKVTGDSSPISEDIDLGHQDNEPRMIKGELYQIAKQAIELYKMIDSVDNMGEVDFPHWWQAKIVLAKNYLQGSKDYLDSALAIGNEEEEIEETTYAGKDTEDDMKKDKKFNTLSSTGKIDAINTVKQGGAVKIG